jgi:hypothetical protein
MGSLLAIPPSVNCSSLVANAFARRICWTLQNYGAYVVDAHPHFWQPMTINGEDDWYDVAEARYGDPEGDLLTLFETLQVVNNNSSSTVGGGGTPRVPALPPLGN